MFKEIPRTHLFLYILLIGIVPIALAVINLISKNNKLDEIEKSLSFVHQSVMLFEKKQALNIAVRNHYRDADHFYIDKYVESIPFLEVEIENLQKIMNQNNFAEDESVKKRLDFLQQSNSLTFSEGAVQSCPLFQEVIETQVHPVEISAVDLQKVLTQIDGVEIGPFSPGVNPPQLIIIDFKLDRRNITPKNEIFSLNMKLLKREFL